jgi:hypothetical protein
MPLKNEVIIFILLNFVVAAFADIVLNDLSKRSKYFQSLRPYFKDKFISEAAAYAGLTVVVGACILLAEFKMLYNKFLPTNTRESVKFLALAYLIGFILDKAIYAFNIFGDSLRPFYEQFGSGNSGALAFIVSLTISGLLQYYIIF